MITDIIQIKIMNNIIKVLFILFSFFQNWFE